MIDEYSRDKAQQKALVISCYPWEWQEVLTVEGAIELQKSGHQVNYIDLSRYSEGFLKNLMRNTLMQARARRNEVLKSYGITISYPALEILKARFLFLFLKYTLPTYRFMLSSGWENIYPGLVDKTGDPQASAENYPKLTRKLAIQDFVFNKLLENCFEHADNYASTLIVNGRFPLNRNAASYFSKKTSVDYIEFGANREKFQIYSVSPHSMKNRRELFKNFFEKHQIPETKIESQGQDFFQNRKRFDNQANIDWTRKMKPEKLPLFASSKKTCTFFPTSEKEFAGVADIPSEEHFKNQFEALDSLIACLGDEWDIYVRRHPKADDSIKDPEKKLWTRFQNFSNVHLIPPDSSVDSYSLGMQSDLVAHYSSFIGPELIFAGHKNVVTLGPTMWEDLDQGRHIHSSIELKKYLSSPARPMAQEKILYVGYFMENFGTQFRAISWNAANGRWLFK